MIPASKAGGLALKLRPGTRGSAAERDGRRKKFPEDVFSDEVDRLEVESLKDLDDKARTEATVVVVMDDEYSLVYREWEQMMRGFTQTDRRGVFFV